MGNAGKLRKVRLSTTPSAEALADLRLGDIVYLDGLIYTAREGVYMRALEESANIPMELPQQSAANFHCSPAATINSDGTFTLGAVTATASFRFAKWLPEWLAKSGAKLVIGKGGMSSQDYKDYFVPNGA
ncbi:MAG: fumarate hydratase C-terminal domain-containing protein, partial [Candidatus Puniceispirillaceae bacterium]